MQVSLCLHTCYLRTRSALKSFEFVCMYVRMHACKPLSAHMLFANEERTEVMWVTQTAYTHTNTSLHLSFKHMHSSFMVMVMANLLGWLKLKTAPPPTCPCTLPIGGFSVQGGIPGLQAAPDRVRAGHQMESCESSLFQDYCIVYKQLVMCKQLCAQLGIKWKAVSHVCTKMIVVYK